MLPFWEILETQEEKDRIILLYDCFKGLLYTVAFAMLREESKAEDVVQDTFLVLMNNLNHIDEEAYRFLDCYSEKKKKEKSLTLKEYSKETDNYIYVKAFSYSVTILKNKIYDMAKTDGRHNVVFVEEYFDNIVGTEKTSPEHLYLKDEMCHKLSNFIKDLKFPYKEALYLRYYNEFSIEDIADVLHKSPDNIRKILSRAREMLKVQMVKEGYGNE